MGVPMMDFDLASASRKRRFSAFASFSSNLRRCSATLTQNTSSQILPTECGELSRYFLLHILHSIPLDLPTLTIRKKMDFGPQQRAIAAIDAICKFPDVIRCRSNGHQGTPQRSVRVQLPPPGVSSRSRGPDAPAASNGFQETC